MKNVSSPRFMIAAPSSGSGKTVITCGLIKLLQDKGLSVQSFKCGPDYIDPMFHRKVLGIPSYNVDTYFTGEELTKALFAEKVEELPEHSLSVVEGVMGFYDGLAGKEFKASSSDVAQVLGLPVILVVDAKGMSRSVVALIKGFLACDTYHSIKGVILNKVSAMTFLILKDLIESETGLCVIGHVPHSAECEWKSRHLGLVLPNEVQGLQSAVSAFAKTISSTLDIDGLLQIAGSAQDLKVSELDKIVCCSPVSDKKIRIAVAQDEAFCFYYEDNMRLLKKLGAEINYFSPLHDTELPACDGIILGGGYPELYGKELEANFSMRASVNHAVHDCHIPVLAECGGFMYLQESLKDKDGRVFKMARAIEGSSFYADRLVRFGYAEFSCGSLKIKGHEFHYFDSTENGSAYDAQKPFSNRNWKCIVQTENVTAGFPHLYYYSCPEFVMMFLKKCLSHTDVNEKSDTSSFFENKSCKYYPCHNDVDAINCLFCYCPLYSRSPCPGNPKYIHKDDGRIIKCCTDCTFPHKKENYARIMKLLKMPVPSGTVTKEYHHGGEISAEDVGRRLIDFSVNVNPLGMPQSVRQVFEQSSELCQIYPDKHCAKLLSAIAKKRKFSDRPSFQDIMIAGNGASELISLAVRAVAPRTALVCAPGFYGYERALNNSMVKTDFHYLQESDGFALADSFFAELQKKPDIVFLCNPNNPTGLCIDKALLKSIAEYCECNGIFLVIDECFLSFADDADERTFVPLVKKFPHVLVIDAFTKIYALPGLRLGYAVSSNAMLIKRMKQLQSEWSVSAIAQVCGIAALADESFVEDTRKIIVAERKFLSEKLRNLGCTVTESHANFMLVKTPVPVYESLLQKEIAVRNCENFTGLGDSFVRIAIKTHEQNEILVKVIEEVLTAKGLHLA